MSTFFLALLSVVALTLCAVRDDSPAAQSRQQAWNSLRALGPRRLGWLALQALAGVALILVVSALRTGVYGTCLALAGCASLIASAVALDRRPVRIHRLETSK
ncbi:hypothetical protein ABZW49_10110 [Nonomuraea wenchangensis]